jgi:diadenosine tetraphosphate (Ap4A) HIT family hydrolase
MSECIFCKIANGDIPSIKIWEDENFLAFLDINPVSEGMTLVIPKEHRNSRIFKNDIDLISKIMEACKKVSEMLENGLDIERVGLIFEGLEVDHLHAKLIPIKEGENIKQILNSDHKKPTTEELKLVSDKILEA